LDNQPVQSPPAGPTFDLATHVRNFATSVSLGLVDEKGVPVAGVHGREGARGAITGGANFGADLIEMGPGGTFELHVHEGAHILYVVGGKGILTVGDAKYQLVPETSVFVPAELPHAVSALESHDGQPLTFLAVGYPHQPVDSRRRMHTVEPGLA